MNFSCDNPNLQTSTKIGLHVFENTNTSFYTTPKFGFTLDLLIASLNTTCYTYLLINEPPLKYLGINASPFFIEINRLLNQLLVERAKYQQYRAPSLTQTSQPQPLLTTTQPDNIYTHLSFNTSLPLVPDRDNFPPLPTSQQQTSFNNTNKSTFQRHQVGFLQDYQSLPHFAKPQFFPSATTSKSKSKHIPETYLHDIPENKIYPTYQVTHSEIEPHPSQ